MMKKKLTVLFCLIISVTAIAAAVFAGGCTGKEQTVWKIAADGGEITARFTDNGNYGYILTVEGNGGIKDFSSEKNAPWYGKSGRVTEIVLSEGITAVGKNTFKNCCYVKSVILPQSVTAIGENSFSQDTKVCARAQISAPDGAKIYMYSETKPADGGYYWHLKDGAASFWETKKILFIGNSFTFYNDMPSLFAQIASAAEENVIVESVTCGSHNLSQFADPADEYGAQVYAKLNARSDYDYVVLQEQSTRPLLSYDMFLDGARTLGKSIYATQDSCKIYMYATWGFPEYNDKIVETSALLKTAYDNVAKQIDAKVCNVGTAFGAVYESNKEINLYNADNRHPSKEGSYLSACVHAATILGVDTRSLTYNAGLDEATATVLKNAAYTAATAK